MEAIRYEPFSLAYADSLRIGTVDFVSPDGIKVMLDIEAPDGIAQYRHAAPFPANQRLCVDPLRRRALLSSSGSPSSVRNIPSVRECRTSVWWIWPLSSSQGELNPLGVLAYEGKDAKGHDAYFAFGTRRRKLPYRRRCSTATHARSTESHR